MGGGGFGPKGFKSWQYGDDGWWGVGQVKATLHL